MKKQIIIAILLVSVSAGCKSNLTNEGKNETNSGDPKLSCKLTSPELQQRKETVLLDLKNCILEKKELPNGYAFKFKGDDQMIDQLVEFAKTERACCDFFSFSLEITGDTNAIWFHITGPPSAKSFIEEELTL